jgi:hypothetical protein
LKIRGISNAENLPGRRQPPSVLLLVEKRVGAQMVVRRRRSGMAVSQRAAPDAAPKEPSAGVRRGHGNRQILT